MLMVDGLQADGLLWGKRRVGQIFEFVKWFGARLKVC